MYLDTNFLFDMKSLPIPLHYTMRRIFQIAITNDSLFLSKNNVVDYSIMVVVDKEKKTIRTGIIDYIQ